MVLLNEVYGLYLLSGRLRAIHGRYFYPVFPFFLAALSIVVHKLKIPVELVFSLVVILALLELDVFIWQTIPFYMGGGF